MEKGRLKGVWKQGERKRGHLYCAKRKDIIKGRGNREERKKNETTVY